MAEADEEKLISTLTWSNSVYSLAGFLQNFHLPQVVLIDVGYYGEDDATTIGMNQIVTLHALQTKEKLVGEDSEGRPIAIPLRCPLKVHVHPLPMACRYDKVVTDQMKFVYPKIKYLLSIPVTPVANEERREEPTPVPRFGSVLRIEEINEEKRSVRFENVETEEESTLTFGSSTTFEPLLDGNEYTLEEVNELFGLPAMVRFVPGRETKAGVSDLGKVTLLHGITDTVVVASDVGDRMCLKLPKDLPLKVRAAEGLMRQEESYATIVETFNRRYLGGSLIDSNEQLDVYEDLNTVTRHVEQLGHFHELKGPELPPRNVAADHPPPERPPKPVTRHVEQLGRFHKLKGPELPPRNVPADHPPPGCPPKHSPSGSLEKSTPPTSLPSQPWKLDDPSTPSCSQGNDIYECECDDTRLQYVEALSDHNDTYTDVKNNEYETVDYEEDCCCKMADSQSKAAGARGVPSPASVSLIPNDLSGLSVEGVSKLLKNLHMGRYVSTFKKELVDGVMLRSLDRASLESLNVSNFHIIKMMKVLEGWRPNIQ